MLDHWTFEDLVEELKMTDIASVRNGLYFWANEGVLRSFPASTTTTTTTPTNGNGEEVWRLLEVRDESAGAGIAHGSFFLFLFSVR